MTRKLLELLEELLSITAPYMGNKPEWRKWQAISAKVADLRSVLDDV